MPIYEFVCRKCSREFEELVPSTRRDAVPCPNCGYAHTARKISLMAPAVVKSGSTSSDYCRMSDCSTAGSGCCGGGCGMD